MTFTFFSGSTAPVAATLNSSSFSLYNLNLDGQVNICAQKDFNSNTQNHISLSFVLLFLGYLLQQLKFVALLPPLRGLIPFSSTYTTQSQVTHHIHICIYSVNKF